MEILPFLLTVVGFVTAGAVWIRSARLAQLAAERETELQTELAAVKQRSSSLEIKTQKAAERLQDLERSLADAVARRDEKAIASTMWELELERSYRQWRDVIVPSTPMSEPQPATVGEQLTFAIMQDVARLREEVGVSIRFDGGVDLDAERETALGMLRIAEELLAMAAKRADDVTVSLDQGDEPSMTLTLKSQGWGEAENVGETDLARTVQQMANRLDGWVRFEQSRTDDVTIIVTLPALIPDLESSEVVNARPSGNEAVIEADA